MQINRRQVLGGATALAGAATLGQPVFAQSNPLQVGFI